MESSILLARAGRLIPVPHIEWEKHLAIAPSHHRQRQAFMTAAHHRVRYFVVEALARTAHPLTPQFIAAQLSLPVSSVDEILGDLERNQLFLVRSDAGEVTWAFPVTVEPTPHRVTLNTGEALYGAWAEDAIALPFVQGHLRNEYITGLIATECAHCGGPLHITVDSKLQVSVAEAGAAPLVFEPDVDFKTLRDPNIIHAYWRNSVFFWSEEHARAHRNAAWTTSGILLTLEQSAYATGIVQRALFAFDH